MGTSEKASTRLGNDSTQGLWGGTFLEQGICAYHGRYEPASAMRTMGSIPADSAQEGGNDPQTVWPTWLRLPTKHVPGVVPGVAIFKAIAQAPRYTQYRWLKTHKKHKHYVAVPLPKQPPQEWPENQSPGGASVSVLKGETIAFFRGVPPRAVLGSQAPLPWFSSFPRRHARTG